MPIHRQMCSGLLYAVPGFASRLTPSPGPEELGKPTLIGQGRTFETLCLDSAPPSLLAAPRFTLTSQAAHVRDRLSFHADLPATSLTEIGLAQGGMCGCAARAVCQLVPDHLKSPAKIHRTKLI